MDYVSAWSRITHLTAVKGSDRGELLPVMVIPPDSSLLTYITQTGLSLFSSLVSNPVDL